MRSRAWLPAGMVKATMLSPKQTNGYVIIDYWYCMMWLRRMPGKDCQRFVGQQMFSTGPSVFFSDWN